MTERSTNGVPNQFDGYPYLAQWLTEECCHLVCLPVASEAQLIAWARAEQAATGLAVQLVLGPERALLIDAFGECNRAGFSGCRFPLDDQLVPSILLPADAECAARSARLAEYCRAHTRDGWLASFERTDIRRLVSTLASAHERQWRNDLWLVCAVCGEQVNARDARRARREDGAGYVVTCRGCSAHTGLALRTAAGVSVGSPTRWSAS